MQVNGGDNPDMRPVRAALLIAAAAALPFGLAAAAPSVRNAPSAAGPNAFGSIGLPLGETRYSSRWNRVAAAVSAPPLGQLVQPARALPRPAQAQFVNAALNRRISYRFDTDPSGDHWATARETLSRGSGDCEDYVIAKMHALRGLGVPASDLFMTIGNDSAAGAVHAVLLIRAGGRFWVLDNRVERPIPQEQFNDFHPIISFSAAGGSWLHGYPRGQTPAAVKAMSAAFAQGRHLALGNSEGSRLPIRR